MATVTFKGEKLNVGGSFPRIGETARSFMLDEHGQVLHSELVPEIACEPDYEAALTAARFISV